MTWELNLHEKAPQSEERLWGNILWIFGKQIREKQTFVAAEDHLMMQSLA